ncbi:MAG TPA: hypothetical protein VF316_22200 [Polyangiaceae bacterium]
MESKLPLTPRGGRLVWPEGLLAVARELGFDPDTRGAGPVDPQIAAGVADAFAQYGLVVVITRAIEAAGGVEDLHVTATGQAVYVRGS